jgi:hypothetical protein
MVEAMLTLRAVASARACCTKLAAEAMTAWADWLAAAITLEALAAALLVALAMLTARAEFMLLWAALMAESADCLAALASRDA